MREYRIEYSIQRRDDDADDEFVEIGFGSSGFWGDLDACAHMVESDISSRSWETEGDMPDPREVAQ